MVLEIIGEFAHDDRNVLRRRQKAIKVLKAAELVCQDQLLMFDGSST
jgi:hypothetical protein